MWDAQTMFSDGQTLADGESDNIVDTGPKDSGKGQALYLQVMTADGATGDLVVALKTSDNADMTDSVTVAEFTAPTDRVAEGGVVISADLPAGCKRYLQVEYSGATGGAVSSGLVLGQHTAQLK